MTTKTIIIEGTTFEGEVKRIETTLTLKEFMNSEEAKDFFCFELITD